MAERAAFVLLAFALVFTTVAYGGVHQPVIAIYYLLVSAAIVILALIHRRSLNAVPSRDLLQIPLFCAAAYAFFQIVPFGSIAETAGIVGIPRTISMDPFSTWTSAFQFTAAALFFSGMLVCINSAKRIRRMCIFLIIFGFGFAFFSILQSVLSPSKIYGIYEVGAGSSFGTFVNRNNYAAFIVMLMGIPLGLLFSRSLKKDQWLLLLTAIALMGISLLLSGSRGGLVAFVSQLILIAVLSRTKGKRSDKLIQSGLIVLLAAAIIGGSIFVGGDTSFTRIAETAASNDFTTDRSHIWRVTISVIGSNLPLGAGFGAFGSAYTKFDDSSGLFRVEQAHNDYLQVLADAGIPGLLIGILFIILFIQCGVRSLRIDNSFRRGAAIGALAGCFAVLVHSLFDFVLHVTAVSLLFLTLLALLSVSQSSYPDDTKDESDPKRRRRRKTESHGELSARSA